MKRFLILLSLLFCNMVYADTINLRWLNEDGTVYENSTCVIDSDLILPATPPTKYGYTFTGWKITSYIPIEYLESTGTQWIDTGMKANFYTKAEVIMQLANHSSSALGYFIGSRSTQNSDAFIIGSQDATLDSSTYYFAQFDSSKPNIIKNKNFDLQKHSIVLSKDGFYIDHELFTTFPNAQSFTTHENIPLFARYSNGELAKGKIIIYSFKMYSYDTLVRDFIPVLDYNGIPCMYDKVTGQFFYNQGTGQFIAGPVLTE